ncbi:hypothetical protein RP20_CCG003669 [Aedes albopictus]|nr:hypothetical protein RP20_CCG003669 [Aedes albopictus]
MLRNSGPAIFQQLSCQESEVAEQKLVLDLTPLEASASSSQAGCVAKTQLNGTPKQSEPQKQSSEEGQNHRCCFSHNHRACCAGGHS